MSKFLKNCLEYFKQKRILILKILFVLIMLEIGSSILINYAIKEKAVPMQKYADEIYSSCLLSDYRPGCYEKKIPELMNVITMENAFEITKLVQKMDTKYTYCHVLGHNISAREVGENPSRWSDVVARCPSGMCSNGCIHGAFQERFREDVLTNEQIEELKPVFSGICEGRENWHPTKMEQATCTHALGHLTMYITDANIDKSVALCDIIAVNKNAYDFRQLCYDGAFMQIFQPLEPEDFALIEGKQPTKEELGSFCSTFKGQQRGSCWSEGWPLYWDEVKTPGGLARFCSAPDEKTEQNRCFSALFYVLTAQFNLEEDRIQKFCLGMPDERVGQCFANAASRMIETDWSMISKSVSLCSIAASVGVGNVCYDELLFYSKYNFHKESQEFYKLCNSLPLQWKKRCLGSVSG